MARSGPPASVEQLRALLDRAAIRRSFITGNLESSGTGRRPLPQGTRVRAVIAEVDHDYMAAIIAEGDRLDSAALASALGARRARVVGPRAVRAWLGTALSQGEEADTGPLGWDEVPLVTQLPTVLDHALLGREFLLGATGEAACLLHIAPAELRRVTAALVAPIAHQARAKA